MADRALRKLDQLQTDRGARCLAVVARAARVAGGRRVADPPPHQLQGEKLMGWLILLLLGASSLGLLLVFGVRGGLFTAGAAALLVGASGYALQGRPNLPGAPASAGEGHEVFPLTDARHAFFGHFTP